ncbi:hypothetical protein NP233_g9704 [Leucocoprinus birnbaumii]|uniref:Uncharacterized protein n=1 Tax=Leucocoprinus birnbaumii TaxID=56174 RepID=A0AAD5VK53_9AGAR|nr:hypothetical protein NP233_g9704 [Leucocoprinus birnbaumii]
MKTSFFVAIALALSAYAAPIGVADVANTAGGVVSGATGAVGKVVDTAKGLTNVGQTTDTVMKTVEGATNVGQTVGNVEKTVSGVLGGVPGQVLSTAGGAVNTVEGLANGAAGATRRGLGYPDIDDLDDIITPIADAVTGNVPAVSPPATNPPAVNPPAVNPPTVNPPAADPPAISPRVINDVLSAVDGAKDAVKQVVGIVNGAQGGN